MNVKKFVKKHIKIEFPDDVVHLNLRKFEEQHVITRWFEDSVTGQSLVITGETKDDNEVWVVKDDKIYLLGTLTGAMLKYIIKFTRKGSTVTWTLNNEYVPTANVTLLNKDFEWLNDCWHPTMPINGKAVSPYDLGPRFEITYKLSGQGKIEADNKLKRNFKFSFNATGELVVFDLQS